MRRVSLKIGDGKDPDTGESCRVMYLDGKIFPWWLSRDTVRSLAKMAKEQPGTADTVYEKTMNDFLRRLSEAVGYPVEMMKFVQSVEEGSIAVKFAE